MKAKIHLTNGEVADVKVLTSDLLGWLDTVAARGISTKEMYIPHHSIVYVLVDANEDDNEASDDNEYEVELEDRN